MKKLFGKLNKLSTLQLLLVTVLGAGLISFSAVFAAAYFNDEGISKSNCKGNCVSLLQNEASPNTLAVTNGSYVQFNSADGKSHSLSLGGSGNEHSHSHKGDFSSGEFKADEAWRVQFTKDGTYTFKDNLNPKINVVVVVYTEGKQYKVE